MSDDVVKQANCGACESEACSAKSKRPSETDEQFEARQAVQRRMCRIKHKVLVLSGKGGVGKSTVAVNMAMALALAGQRVGLLDVDVHGPSVPKMLGIEGSPIQTEDDALLPVEVDGVKVMSIGLLLPEGDEAIIWRGPMKMGVIQQFLKDVAWGDLDFLVIDSPPGTGDEPLSACQLIENADGAVVVTTPQEVSVADVRRCVNFCRRLNLPVLGVIENMSGFVCPHCGQETQIFKSGGGVSMAADMGAPFLGKIPLDPQVADACDAGNTYIQQYADSPAAVAMLEAVRPILEMEAAADAGKAQPAPAGNSTKRIAIPVADGKLAMHFGHCEQFAFFDVDLEGRTVVSKTTAVPPAHEPGVLPRWLSEQGAHVIISGGMGSRAQGLFADQDIDVIVGARSGTPEAVVQAYLDDTLETGANICDH